MIIRKGFFDSNAFGEITRLVNVTVAEDGIVAGQESQSQGKEMSAKKRDETLYWR